MYENCKDCGSPSMVDADFAQTALPSASENCGERRHSDVAARCLFGRKWSSGCIGLIRIAVVALMSAIAALLVTYAAQFGFHFGEAGFGNHAHYCLSLTPPA